MVSITEFKQMLENNKDILILDVRTTNEFNQSSIPNCIHIPMQKIPNKLNTLSKNKEIIVYCHSGGRSFRVCAYLNSLGYNVKNLEGGIKSYLIEN